ncbi:MAG: histidine kinase [Gemmatimonadaceae bacterium]
MASESIAINPFVLIAVWTVPGLLACFQRWATGIFDQSPVSFAHVLLVGMPSWYLWAALTPLIFQLVRRFPLQPRPTVIPVIAHVFAWLVCLTLHAVLNAATARAFDAAALTMSFLSFTYVSAISWMPSTFLLYAATIGVAMWMQSTERERQRERERAELSEQLARAELNALRSQLHPHFLFNTLNTIAILIRESETSVAEHLVTQLGDVLRQVFRGARAHETALGEEITLARTYLAIEQVRFGERLSVQWCVADDLLDAAVPVLLLQPLIENALRHGVATQPGPAVIEVGTKRDGGSLLVWVADNGDARSDDELDRALTRPASGGVGLANTKARLERLYPNAGTLRLTRGTHGGTRAEVRVPYRAWNDSIVDAALI